VTDRDASGHPVRLAREAFALSFRGSRRDLAEVTAWRMHAGLVFVWLAGRCVHLVQAGTDLAAGLAAYTRPGLAEGLAVACLAESALLARAMVRAQRLTLGPLLCDAAFGIVGLAVMSAATSATPARAGSLNWMLPYTVATAAGLGLLLAQGGTAPAANMATAAGRWRLRWLQRAVPVLAVAALAAAYLVSVMLPRRLPGDPVVQLWANDANYAGFFLAAVAVAVLVRRRLALISQRNEEAGREASQLSREAYWRATTGDVFGPVLDLLDGLALIGEVVPASLREEAARLIGLIEAVRPGTAGWAAAGPGVGAAGEDGGLR
jgi:hypothetical protein